nr:MAG TPA: hypothetical protein [Bacteriophage sp.]
MSYLLDYLLKVLHVILLYLTLILQRIEFDQ